MCDKRGPSEHNPFLIEMILTKPFSSQPLLIRIILSQNAALSSVLGESISVDYKRVSKDINI